MCLSTVSSSASRKVSLSVVARRAFAVSAEAPNFKSVDPRVRYPKLYFDLKLFQQRLKKKKIDSLEWERRAVRHLFVKEAPEVGKLKLKK